MRFVRQLQQQVLAREQACTFFGTCGRIGLGQFSKLLAPLPLKGLAPPRYGADESHMEGLRVLQLTATIIDSLVAMSVVLLGFLGLASDCLPEGTAPPSWAYTNRTANAVHMSGK